MKDKEKRKKRNHLLFTYLKKVKAPISIGFTFSIITVLAALWGPKVMANILDKDLSKGLSQGVWNDFYVSVALFLMLSLLSPIARYLGYYYLHKSSNGVAMAVREDVFARIQAFPIAYFDSLPVGQVVSRITNDTKKLRTLFELVLWQMGMAIISIFGVYFMLFSMRFKFGLAAMLPWPILAFFMLDYKRKSQTIYQKIRAHTSALNAWTHESIVGMKVIQAYGMEKFAKKEFQKENTGWLENDKKFDHLISWSGYNLMGVLRHVTLATLIFYFGYGVLTKSYQVSTGELFILVSYFELIYNYIQNVMNQISNLESSLAAADHVFELLEMDVEKTEKHGHSLRGDVEFSKVGFSYVEGEKVLKDINFHLKKGETMAFVGATGSGKSSLMNLLFRFYDPKEGKITIGGVDTKTVSPQVLRENMGIVLQDAILFEGTLYSNICLNNPNISREDAKKALIDVGAGHLLQREKGLDASVSSNGNTYSAGERQLISFARALAHEPEILVLDEATSNVDTETEQKIQQAIQVVKKGRSTFIIAHRLSTIKDANQILVLSHGEIVERGNHQALMQKGGAYYKLYEYQAQNARQGG